MNVGQQVVAHLLKATMSPQALTIGHCIIATLLLGTLADGAIGAVWWFAARRRDSHLVRPSTDLVPIGIVVDPATMEIVLNMVPGRLNAVGVVEKVTLLNAIQKFTL